MDGVMQKPTLTGKQVRALIEAAGVGASFTEKSVNVASRVHSSKTTLFRYLREGTPSQQAPFFLLQLAYEYQIIERPDNSAGAFIL
jgi:hypothetical protein